MAQATVDEYLKSIYYNSKRLGSFGGVENLYKYRDVKQKGTLKLSRKKNFRMVNGKDTYTLHN